MSQVPAAARTADRTAGAAVDQLAKIFACAGLDTPRLDARMLVAHALGVGADTLRTYPETKVSQEAQAEVDRLAARRLQAREPVSRILGKREFWSLPFSLSAATLDPRPDSETLVAAALTLLPADRPARVLDLGTGTGCLLLSILSERPQATGIGIDIDADAVETARVNGRRLGLASRADFQLGNWAAGLAETFDLVISNPPYIPTADIAGLAPEVRVHDPQRALDGGADGLDAIRLLSQQLPALLADSGCAVVELGAGQADPAGAVIRDAGLHIMRIERDLAGIERCLILQKSPVNPA